MHAAEGIIAVFTRTETLMAFLLFIVPGLLSLRTYEALMGGEPRKMNDVLIDVAVYSFATDVVWIPALIVELRLSDPGLRAIAVVVSVVVGMFGTAIFVGWSWYQLQRRLVLHGLVRDPVQRPWDKMFGRIVEERLDVGIVVTLSDGRKLGGRFAAPGFASSSPAAEQLHVGESWMLDERGRFTRRVHGTYGFLVDKRDILALEFFDWDSVAGRRIARGEE